MVAVTLGRRVVDRERRESTRVDLGKYTMGVGELAGFNVASSCSCSLPIGADSQRCGLSECPSSTAIRPDSWDEVSDES